MKFGIDVSRWNKGIDFSKAKSEGVEFVIIKCSQADFTDSCFEDHYKKAKANGLGVGAYHYLKANSIDGAVTEARYCISTLKGKQFDYPIYLDFEESVYTKNSKTTNTDIIKAFCTELEKAGYWAGFYTNNNYYQNYINGKELSQRFALWIASWGSKKPISGPPMWQFGGETNVIRTNKIAGMVCDQNYCYIDYPTMIKANGLNGYTLPENEPENKKDYEKIGKQAEKVMKEINDLESVKTLLSMMDK